jgi:DNA polymerase-3 subunit gamma/tau
MSYLVLARKYRPKQFQELVGQQHVATTLLNSFRQNKLGQAYLLTGTRGVGKTSVARIFAKALRCENPDAQPGGKTPGISCDQCPSCLEINSGSSIDVLEIDGASNNGVENVREIREQVKFMPSRGKTKVYIIDEVHMLTNAAFNALLKTLEEPPPHITFILATTEVQKIPATILSRCQRFDFRRVPQALIQEHLHKILQMEGIAAESAALRLIAQKADGSVRDALSAMDQCLAMSGKQLTVQSVTDALGIVSQKFLLDILQFAFARQIVPAAEKIQEAFLAGVEMKQLALGLAETLRTALFVKLRAGENLTEISKEERSDFESLVENLSPEQLQAAFRVMNVSLEEILKSPLPKASLEMTLARLAGLSHLKSLENFFAGNAVSPPGMTNNTSVGAASSAGGRMNPPPPTTAAKVEKKSFDRALAPTSGSTNTATINGVTAPNSANAANTANAANATANHSHPTPSQTSQTKGGSSFEAFIQFLLQQKASLGALLEHAIPVAGEKWLDGAEVRIGFRKNHSFYQMQAQHRANFEQLEKHLQSFCDKKVKLVIESVAAEGKSTTESSLMERKKESVEKTAAEKKKKFLEHEIVRNTKEIFGAELSSFDIDRSKSE